VDDASYRKTAVSVLALHDALLYFDNVISMTGPLEVGWTLAFERRNVPNKYDQKELLEITKTLLLDVLPEQLQNEVFKSKLADFYGFSTTYIKQQLEEYAAGRPTNFDQNVFAPYQSLIDDYGLRDYPFCTAPQFVNLFERQSDDLSITIASLRLINSSNATLQQLLEFRRDPEAKIKLRRFRLFAYENYSGKSRAFIEDDINKRLVDYDDTVKKWGFETKAAAFTALIDSKLVAGGIAGSFITAYLHEPSLAIASSLLTAGITIGKIGIEVGKRHFAFNELAAGSPVSYVEYAQEKLGS
jgi:hypothetical protein